MIYFDYSCVSLLRSVFGRREVVVIVDQSCVIQKELTSLYLRAASHKISLLCALKGSAVF